MKLRSLFTTGTQDQAGAAGPDSLCQVDPFLAPGAKPKRNAARRMSPAPTLAIEYPVERPPHIPQHNWDRYGDAERRKFSDLHHLRLAKEAAEAAKPKRKRAQTGPKFTTEYAVKWGRAKGWKLTDREGYDARLKRHHDLEGGADVRFRAPDGTVIFVQGAGRSERAEHWARFEERRHQLKDFNNPRFIYIEFDRGNTTPIKEEEWT